MCQQSSHLHIVEDKSLPLAVPVAVGARRPWLCLWPWLMDSIFRIVVNRFLNNKQYTVFEKLASWLKEQPVTQNTLCLIFCLSKEKECMHSSSQAEGYQVWGPVSFLPHYHEGGHSQMQKLRLGKVKVLAQVQMAMVGEGPGLSAWFCWLTRPAFSKLTLHQHHRDRWAPSPESPIQIVCGRAWKYAFLTSSKWCWSKDQAFWTTKL